MARRHEISGVQSSLMGFRERIPAAARVFPVLFVGRSPVPGWEIREKDIMCLDGAVAVLFRDFFFLLLP